MGIQTRWDDSETGIIHLVVESRWDWADAAEAVRLSHDMIDACGLMVAVLIEFRHESWIPGGFNRHLAEVLSTCHPNVVFVGIITASNLLRSLVYGFVMFVHPLPFKFQFFESHEQARNSVLRYRAQCRFQPSADG